MWSVPDVNHVSGTDLEFLACPARFERATYALEAVNRELKQLGQQFHKLGKIWCPIRTENHGVGWNCLQQTVASARGQICRVNRHFRSVLLRDACSWKK